MGIILGVPGIILGVGSRYNIRGSRYNIVSDEVLPPQNPVSLTSLVSAYESSSGASAYTCSVIAEPCRWKDP